MSRVRTRLSPAEREARRRARSRRSFSDAAYEHYDTSQGFGSAREWADAAERMSSGRGYRQERPRHARTNPDLELLGLTEMPEHVNELKTAFRKTLFKVHPDHGGTNEECRQVIAAFERLVRNY